jgi:hypothetical protein
MSVGAVILLAVMLLALHYKTDRSPAGQIAFKAKRADLVAQISLALVSASEAEKSAVLAVTDQDSQTFADQARAAAAEAERESNELDKLLAGRGTHEEKELFTQFSKAFDDFKNIDNELLALAVKNTNVKAYSLAFGPAADAVRDMDTDLSGLAAKSAGSTEAQNIAPLAFGAQAGALRIQAMLAPHIAEESDTKMDEIEAKMAREDNIVRKDLDGLASSKKLRGDPGVAKAAADYAKFSEIRKRILALSRENTNVRSLSMSLGQKRKVSLQCQDILSALKQAILKEPVAGVDYEGVSNPRSLEGSKPKEGK